MRLLKEFVVYEDMSNRWFVHSTYYYW